MERGEPIQRTTVHFSQAVVVEMAAGNDEKKSQKTAHWGLDTHKWLWEGCCTPIPKYKGRQTHSTCIPASPQKAPSVSLFMLFLCSFSTSKLSNPWKVRPSIKRILFRFSSLKQTHLYTVLKNRRHTKINDSLALQSGHLISWPIYTWRKWAGLLSKGL